eukprot:TRINITY_DN9200_c0_g2_i2.p1 TRINITY_DN9200_c0_g2~~TRINITY_DN9200_c0_g2_i2.p1  ORF type:complete len:433 (-),score=102.83 TRINITY_DN9200_c0_g2_i2:222-1520(-)
MILFGGKAEEGPLADCWSYDFELNQWSPMQFPEDEAKATPKAYHSVVMCGDRMLMFGGEAEQGTSCEMFDLSFASATQQHIQEAQQALEQFEPLPDEPEFTAGERQKSLRRAVDECMYRGTNHWHKHIPKCAEGEAPRLSGHYSVMYSVEARNPHRPNPGHVMLVFGGFCDNFMMLDLWELDLPHMKVPVWRRLSTTPRLHKHESAAPSCPPGSCNHFAACSVNHLSGAARYAEGEDPALEWDRGQNLLVCAGKLGPSQHKISVSNFDLGKREWTKVRMGSGPSNGSLGKMVLAGEQWIYVGANQDVCFPLEIHLREEVQQAQRNKLYPGFFGATQTGGGFKLKVPTELEQRERVKGRTRILTVARPSDREAKALAKAQQKVAMNRGLRKAEFWRTMNPPERPQNLSSEPPLSLMRLESMPQYFTPAGRFRP